ncbi:MAG: Rrf2 family transcriptional regulator [Clostridia bacterium]|nr:Rrf2 family transcriptional regulator [Clostridia bacterium]
MRITQEADYALRMVTLLAVEDSICGAGEIADRTGVPERFTHKILRKLMQGGILSSFAGAKGGYRLSLSPEAVSMLDIVELIDGPLEISKCADDSYVCSKNGACKTQCRYHQIFRLISSDIAEKMRRLTIARLIDPTLDMSDIEKIIL